ncbi:acyl-CoA dehydrogenase family protein [Myxococcota bacterium]|nr:acyl-CoA dehydrogenase family protein [Myxococcota bacterium]
MDFALNDIQEAIRDVARRASQKLLALNAAAYDEGAIFPEENLKALGEMGLFGVNIPERWGGAEAGAVSYALAIRELAAGCAATAVTVAVTNMVAEAINAFGDEVQKARYLTQITAGAYPAASFSLSEPGSGSDAASLRATAVREGDEYVLNGTKAWVTSGGHAGLYLVMARTDPDAPPAKGISAFLVEAGTPGMTASKPEKKLGLRASTTTELVFEGCRVPAENRLGPEGIGFQIAMTALDGGRIGVSAQACGIATAAHEAATRYATERAQFGRPIGDFQAIQWMIADSATQLEAAWLLCLRAASLKDAKVRFTREAAMSKVFCTEAANEICHRAVQILGGYGYTREYPVERHLRDARVTRIYEGTSEVQRVVIAREILKSL